MQSLNMDQRLLIDHLKSIHQSVQDDFRWENLRKLVKTYLKTYNKLEANRTRVLDLGCGTGHLTLDLLKDEYNVISVDVSEELIEFTKRMTKKAGYSIDAKVLDIIELDPKQSGTFNAVICLDVVEHVKDDEHALRNINHVLEKDGLLICTVPAFKSLYGIRDKKIGHVRRYNKKELINKVEAAGFYIEFIRYWNFIGLPAFAFSEKILHKSVYEKIRYSKSYKEKCLNAVLNFWFREIENRIIVWPLGLTLIVIARKE